MREKLKKAVSALSARDGVALIGLVLFTIGAGMLSVPAALAIDGAVLFYIGVWGIR